MCAGAWGRFTGIEETVILGDVTYGACCVDDFTAEALGCDFLVHYGHSCLVPVTMTRIKTLYVFVEIGFDTLHFLDTLKFNFSIPAKLALIGTVQFIHALPVLFLFARINEWGKSWLEGNYWPWDIK